MTSVFAQRSNYLRQGIRFQGGFMPLLSERKVTNALDDKLTRDHLFINDPTSDFIGTWRGSRIQLYAVSRRAIEAVVNPKVAGVHIDRDTSARYSFGQLSPSAITFSTAASPSFRERKRNMIVATSSRFAVTAMAHAIDSQSIDVGGSVALDMRPVVTACVRDAVAAAVWGDAAAEPVPYIDWEGVTRTIPFADAMYDNFLRLRRVSNNYAMRVEPRLQCFPFTQEQRWTRANTRALRRHISLSPRRPLDNTIAGQITRLHGISGFTSAAVHDDTTTTFIAAVDTTRTAILATLKHLLNPVNRSWMTQVSAVSPASVTESVVIRACVLEAMRVDTPGSVFNGRVVDDFDISFGDSRLSLYRNTLVMPNIHALHASYGPVFDPGRLIDAHPAELIIPFGKGPRSCPGRSFASSMIAVYVNAFLRSYPHAELDAQHGDNHYPIHTASEHGLYVALNGEPARALDVDTAQP